MTTFTYTIPLLPIYLFIWNNIKKKRWHTEEGLGKSINYLAVIDTLLGGQIVLKILNSNLFYKWF